MQNLCHWGPRGKKKEGRVEKITGNNENVPNLARDINLKIQEAGEHKQHNSKETHAKIHHN